MKIHYRKINLLLLLLLLTGLISCKTTEEIQREQLLDNIAIQMVKEQKINADLTVKVQSLEDKFGMATGRFEESSQKTKQSYLTRLKNLKEEINIIQESQNNISQRLNKQETQIGQQKKFLTKILDTLSQLTGKKKKKSRKKRTPKTSKKKLSPYEQAMSYYRKRQYKRAKPLLLKLLANKKYKQSYRARILHNLGMIEFIGKSYESALVYFSRLISDFSKSPYTANGLLYLGKSFLQLKKKAEAKQTFQELIKRFPKHNKAKEAQQLIKKI